MVGRGARCVGAAAAVWAGADGAAVWVAGAAVRAGWVFFGAGGVVVGAAVVGLTVGGAVVAVTAGDVLLAGVPVPHPLARLPMMTRTAMAPITIPVFLGFPPPPRRRRLGLVDM